MRIRPLLLALALAGGLAAAEPADPTAGPPDKASPSTPGWGFWPKYPKDWVRTFEGQLGRAKQGDIGVVFVGDSTRQVLWRIEHGLLDTITPGLVVVAIGTNNLYGDYNAGTDAEIADGIAAVVKAVRAKLPKAKVLVQGILPRQNAYFCGRVAAVNALAAKLDDGKDVRFLDPGAAFLDAPGTVKADLFQKDQVHLTPAGYQVLGTQLKPLVDTLLK